ncbi:MAG: hypothetical protein ACE5G9_09500 [Nitrospinales bacterium]
MPTIEPANTQQVLQMSPLAEKLQQTAQQQSTGLTQQLGEEDRAKLDELKRTEVQDPENKNPTDPANPDGTLGRGRLRIRKKGRKPRTAESKESPPVTGGLQENKIDVIV